MNTAPNHFLHADSAGGALPSLPTRSKMLPIRQSILATRGLRAEPKEVLVKVCELFENGKRKQCDVTNAGLAEMLGSTGKNISRLISGLVSNGWLTVLVFPAQGNRRLLVPTEKTRTCYLPETAGGVSPLMALSGDTPQASEDTPEMGIPHPRNGDTLTPEMGIPSPQKWGDLTSKEYKKEFKKEGGGSAREISALAAAEKKIAELEAKNAELTAEVEKVTTQRDQLRNTLKAQRPAPQAGGAGRLMNFEDSEFNTEAGFRALATRINCGQACAAYYLPLMRVKAEDMPQRDAPGWKNYVTKWLSLEGPGLKTQLPTPTVAGGSDALRRLNQASSAADLLLSGAITSTSLNR